MSSERLIYSPVEGLRSVIDNEGLRILNQFDQAKPESSSFYCCTSSMNKQTSLNDIISFEDILWCEHEDTDDDSLVQLFVTYLDVNSGSKRPKSASLTIETSKIKFPKDNISKHILELAYKNSKISPSVLVIVNPHGGQGKALKIYESEILPILKAAHVNVELKETTYYQHAITIARELDISKYDIIACCSGDGVPHEIINGLYQRPDRASAFNKLVITQLPGGSGNALSISTHGNNNAIAATISMLKSQRIKLDAMSFTQGVGSNKVTKLSFLSQTFGIIADSDIGTEHLRWMGAMRFDVGVAQRVFAREKFPCKLHVKYTTTSKPDLEQHFRENFSSTNSYTTLTEENFKLMAPSLNEDVPSDWVEVPEKITQNLSIFYVGKLPYISSDVQFFPAALPNDGSMDMVITDTNSSVLETANILLSLDKGSHVHNPNVVHAKIKAYRLEPKLSSTENHYISVDGESFPVESFQVEVLPKLITIALPKGRFVNTCFTNKVQY